jgi:hypothetical protein
MSAGLDTLFDAAREDAPALERHDAMWDRIADATGLAASAAAGAPATTGTAAKIGGTKLLAVGGLIGAASTALGVAVALLAVGADMSSAPGATPARAAAVPVHSVAPGAKLAEPAVRKRAVVQAPAESAVRDQSSAGQATKGEEPASGLAEEARLVSAARAALVGGDPQRALSLIQSARRLSSHALEPEELGLEARALSALGRTDEAAATDLLLRRRYPESALAR